MKETNTNKKFLSIKTKASIFISVASIIIVLTGLSIISFYGSRLIKKSTISNQKTMTKMLALTVSEMIEEEIDEIRLITSGPRLKDTLIKENSRYDGKSAKEIENNLKLRNKKWMDSINSDLKSILKFENEIIEFIVTDKFGALIASFGDTSDPFLADNNWWKKSYNNGIGKIFIGEISYDKASDSFVLPIARPIKDNEGNIIGISKALVDAKNLFYPLNNFYLGEKGHAVLTDENGKILFHPKVNAFGIDFMKNNLFIKLINSESGWMFVDSPHIHREEIFITMAKVNEKNLKVNDISWVVFIDNDAKIIFKPLRKFITYIIYLTPLLILISIPVGFVFGGIFTKPLNRLTLRSKAIGEGNLSTNFNIETNDEIGVLASEFNKMVKKLNQSTTSIKALNEEIEKGKITEGSLNKLTKEWSNTFNSITDLIYIQDLDCKIINANKAFYKAMQLTTDEVIGKKCYNIFHGTNEPWVCCPFRDSMDALKTKTTIIENLFIEIPLLITTSPIFDENKKLIGTVHHAKDMTKQKKAEELIKKNQKKLEEQTWGLQKTNDSIKILYKELEDQNTKLKEYDRLKSEFISTVSHELRTPLSIIKESIGLILDRISGNINEEQKKILTPAKTNIDRLQRIINDLLDISKIEDGKVEIKKTLTNLTSLVDHTVKFFGTEARKKGLQLRADVPLCPVEMYVDSDKIIQVLTNLIGNAIKFTGKGYIEVALSWKKNMAVFSVKDTGIGIPNNDIITIFDKFHQVDRTFGPGIKGTGLGLAISKKLVEMHNGAFTVVSEPDVGSTFTFEIPGPNPLAAFKDILENELLEIEKDTIQNISVILINIIDYELIIETLGLDFYEEFFNLIIFESKKCFRNFEDKTFGEAGKIIILMEDITKENSLIIKNRIEKHIFELISNSEYLEIKNLNFTISIASHHDEAKEFMRIVNNI